MTDQFTKQTEVIALPDQSVSLYPYLLIARER
jgi:hypothetical protein